MKKIIYHVFFYCTALISVCFGQTINNENINVLNVGDKVPDLVLDKIINYKTPTAKLSDFKGKILILDFWATWCSGCIQAMPDLQALQAKFEDQLMILPVNSSKSTGDSLAKAKAAFAKNKIDLPSITEDQQLAKMFPHIVIPHEVWIDQNGVVIAITGAEEVTEKHIKAIIDGQRPALKIKTESLTADSNKPLDGIARPDNEILYRSILTSFRPDINGGYHRRFTQFTKRINFTNSIPSSMFEIAAFQNPMKKKNRIIYDVTDTCKWKMASRDWKWPNSAWQSFSEWENAKYTYELIMPAKTPDSIVFSHMFHELNMFFPLKASIEYKQLPCWKLERIDNTKEIPASTLAQSESTLSGVSHKGDLVIKLSNTTAKSLVLNLNMFNGGDEIFDETGIGQTFDISIDYRENKTYNGEGSLTNSPLDFELIQKELIKYNLKLVHDKCVQPVLILTDKPEIYSKWKL